MSNRPHHNSSSHRRVNQLIEAMEAGLVRAWLVERLDNCHTSTSRITVPRRGNEMLKDTMTISEMKTTCCCGARMIGPRCTDHPKNAPLPLSLYDYDRIAKSRGNNDRG